MIKEMMDFFESEYERTKTVVSHADKLRAYVNPNDAVWYAIQRCLGVAEFVNGLYKEGHYEVQPIYEFYKEKLEKLLDK